MVVFLSSLLVGIAETACAEGHLVRKNEIKVIRRAAAFPQPRLPSPY